MLAVAAVALAAVAGGLGGWGLRTAPSSPASTQLAAAPLLSASHQSVGKIFLYQGSPRWLYMSVNMRAGTGTVPNGTLICQVQGRDGRYTTVGSSRLSHGYGSWGSPPPATLGAISGARLITTSGSVLATARFHAA